jgi:alpha-D-ribose 1-methylphosphonate 5-phosphate C-P lyase
MITPIAQRQMFQTINVEAVKSANEVAGLLQRETMHRQALQERMAEDQVSVPEIPVTEHLRTEDRQGRQQDQGHPGGHKRDGEAPEADPNEANPAEMHMDFLA